MKTKFIIASLFLSAGVCSISYADTVDSTSICPTDLKYKTIGMRDMSFRYAQYKDHICAILEVDLNKNKQWREKGSGWFAAGFGAKTMKGSNMFIFVPNKSQSQDIRYDIFANIGGAYGPTKPLDTKPQKGQIELLSSSLAKVEFALYPQKIPGLATNGNIDMIFSHSKAGVYQFAPGHVAAYDDKAINLK
ncbi:hypothetical protein B4919_07455 [Francisella tularensis subsp. novicida]|uniref:hypothetical protein n=1 Tax=Francisella tularensis TaxID=263 RepID=UPI0002058B57|nr:hypothetical protein [Francisella tularensis]AEB27555.1 hypothetical protein FNFX1_0607 [Francisella cf. novicida Fx1]APA82667.1 hypothetical protein N894_0683 [Francisella tularensis subsp. novicida PA10-7858]AVC44625.1 hypothetical protein B4919_07455 [Francisella tularensis subsp. novicida]